MTAGDTDARHGHLAEFGTEERHDQDGSSAGTMHAEPFLLPACRLNKASAERRIKKAISDGAKKTVAGIVRGIAVLTASRPRLGLGA